MELILSSRLMCSVLGTFALAFTLGSGVVRADVYDFSMMTGGGQASLAWAGKNVLVEVGPGPASNTVSFKFTNQIRVIEGDSKIPTLAGFRFDTGLRSDLFTSVSIGEASTGVAMQMFAPTSHPFFAWLRPTFTPDYQVGIKLNAVESWGINPGEHLVVVATLAAGKTLADVLDAMDEGITPSTAGAGLRIIVTVWQINGSALYDDAMFVTNARVSEVSPPPPPPPPPGTC